MSMEIVPPYVIPLSSVKPKTLTLVPSEPGSRYKTRQLQVQIVGKSKMIKTVLLNILDVAKDCQVPPSYIGTYMGYVIGAQAKFEPKKPERQQAFLSGEHDPKDLSKIFLTFITEVLLCPSCALPEILIEPEGKSVLGTCRACSFHGELKIQDEKFKRYIINHPPSQSKGAFGGNRSKSTADKAKNDEDKDDKSKENQSDKKDSSNGSSTSATTSASTAEKVIKKATKTKKEEEEVVWFSDTSEEAARKRREEMLPDSMNDKQKAAAFGIDEELVKDLKEALKSGKVESIKEVKTKRSVTDDKVFVGSLLAAAFPTDCDLLSETKAKIELVQKFITTPGHQLQLLQFIENFCGKDCQSQLSKVPLVIKECYDRDVVEEDSILNWYEKEKTGSIATVREKAAPMISWLKEAEEESEGEEEEED